MNFRDAAVRSVNKYAPTAKIEDVRLALEAELLAAYAEGVKEGMERAAKIAESCKPDPNWGEGMPMGGDYEARAHYNAVDDTATKAAAKIRAAAKEGK